MLFCCLNRINKQLETNFENISTGNYETHQPSFDMETDAVSVLKNKINLILEKVNQLKVANKDLKLSIGALTEELQVKEEEITNLKDELEVRQTQIQNNESLKEEIDAIVSTIDEYLSDIE